MDIKMTCALAILNACLGNDPSQVTERMNALREINRFGKMLINPYIEVIKEVDISPQEYSKYSLMPLIHVMSYTPGNICMWKDALDKVHDIVDWYYTSTDAFPLYEHAAINLLRYSAPIRRFVQDDKLCDHRSQQTLTKLYIMIQRISPVDCHYNKFLQLLNEKGLKYAVLNCEHSTTVRYAANIYYQRRKNNNK